MTDQAPGGLLPGSLRTVAGLHLGNTRATTDVEGWGGGAVEVLKAGRHLIGRRRQRLDGQMCFDARLLMRQELVHRSRGQFAVGDRLDEISGTKRDIAAREYAGSTGGQCDRIDANGPRRLKVNTVGLRQECEVRLLPNRQNAGVGIHDDDIVVVIHRRKAASVVKDRVDRAKFDGRESAVGADEAARSGRRGGLAAPPRGGEVGPPRGREASWLTRSRAGGVKRHSRHR